MVMDVEEVALRSGTTAEWTASGLVLDTGELGVDNTTGEVKRGDGSSAFAALPSLTPKKVTVTLAGGTKLTAEPRVKAATVILPVLRSLGTVTSPKVITVTRVADTSFTLTSADGTDTSVFDVLLWF